jgi:hypothetical protein
VGGRVRHALSKLLQRSHRESVAEFPDYLLDQTCSFRPREAALLVNSLCQIRPGDRFACHDQSSDKEKRLARGRGA